MTARPQTLTIGRGRDCDLLLTHSSISRRHAELTIGPDGSTEIRDLQSTGGTFILRGAKEIPVTTASLKSTDTLRLGEYDIAVSDLLSLIPSDKSEVKSKRVSAKVAGGSSRPVGAAPKSRMMRCACGSIKERGKSCPDCGS